MINFIKENKLQTAWILDTHAHADHITAAQYLKAKLGGKYGIGKQIQHTQQIFTKVFNLAEDYCGPQDFDHLFSDGDTFEVGSLTVKVMHTPGHTPACICYYVENEVIFVGDTLFLPDQGTARCDFPGGSAEDLWGSLEKITSLPDDVMIYVGHDYAPGGREYAWKSTVAEEKKNNAWLKEGKDAFLTRRKERDATLGAPKLLIPSIQSNIRAGKMPPPERNNVSYFKVPINLL